MTGLTGVDTTFTKMKTEIIDQISRGEEIEFDFTPPVKSGDDLIAMRGLTEGLSSCVTKIYDEDEETAHEALRSFANVLAVELARLKLHGSISIVLLCVMLVTYPLLVEANETDTYDPGRGFAPDIENLQDSIEGALFDCE